MVKEEKLLPIRQAVSLIDTLIDQLSAAEATSICKLNVIGLFSLFAANLPSRF